MNASENIIREIEKGFGYHQSTKRYSAETVKSWMDSSDLEVMGAVLDNILINPESLERIVPRITEEEIFSFRLEFLGRCLLENPCGMWAYDRVRAARSVLREFWDNDIRNGNMEQAHRIKDWLGRISELDNAESRQAVLVEILSKLFRELRWRDFFSDWQREPKLKPLYESAYNVGVSHSSEPVMDAILQAAKSDLPIEKETAESWMESSSLEVMGAAWELIISEDDILQRIVPPLTISDLQEFYLRYYERAIVEDPHDRWGLSAYGAANDMLAWFRSPHTDECLAFPNCLKDMLGRVYKMGDRETFDVVVNGALEHILQSDSNKHLFSDWLDDPVLRKAYGAATGCYLS